MTIHLIKLCFSVFFVSIAWTAQAQKNALWSEERLQNLPAYTLLQEALKTPEAVYKLVIEEQALDELPATVKNLKNLRYLKLTSAGLQQLPPEIGTLKHLQYLDVSFNSIKKLPPEIGKLRSLQNLNLNFNWIESLPPTLAKLKNLHTLSLAMQTFTRFPPVILELKNLRYLNIGAEESEISQIPEEISTLQKLEELYLGSSCCTAPPVQRLPAGLFQLPALRVLHVPYTLLEQIPDEIAQLKSLEELAVYQMPRLRYISPSIFQLENLQLLILGSYSKEADFKAIKEGWAQLKNLEHLQLVDIFDEGFPRGICMLSSLKSLEFMNHRGVSFIPAEIALLKNLEYLGLNRNGIQRISSAIQELPRLKDLQLKDNPLSDVVKQHLRKWLPATRIDF